MKHFFRTGTGFAAVVIGSTVLIVLCYVALVLSFDPNEQNSYGLPSSVAKQFAGTYGPIVVASLVGFRNILFGGISFGPAPPQVIRIRHGAGLLYGVVGVGVVVALGTMLVVARSTMIDDAIELMAVAAAVWAGTVGFTLERFLTAGSNANPPGNAPP